MKEPAAQASGSNKILMVLGLVFVFAGVAICAAINILDRKPADFVNLRETSAYQIEHTSYAKLNSGEFCITAKGRHAHRNTEYSNYAVCFQVSEEEVVDLIVTTYMNSEEEKFDAALRNGGVCDFDIYLGIHQDCTLTDKSKASFLRRAGKEAKSTLGLEDAQLVTINQVFETESPDTSVIADSVDSPRFQALCWSYFIVPLGFFMWFKRKKDTPVLKAARNAVVATAVLSSVYIMVCINFDWK